MLTKRDLLRSAALAAITAATANSVPVQAQTRAEWPDIREAKAIAEEGFIYGLPIVMNYAVMYEYSVDKNSGQYKAPFNQIKNEARVYTYKDTAIITPNSDTPRSEEHTSELQSPDHLVSRLLLAQKNTNTTN